MGDALLIDFGGEIVDEGADDGCLPEGGAFGPPPGPQLGLPPARSLLDEFDFEAAGAGAAEGAPAGLAPAPDETLGVAFDKSEPALEALFGGAMPDPAAALPACAGDLSEASRGLPLSSCASDDEIVD